MMPSLKLTSEEKMTKILKITVLFTVKGQKDLNNFDLF